MVRTHFFLTSAHFSGSGSTKCMFGDVLVAQSLERHPDNLIPLLGNHLFFCRSVRYVLPLVIFTSKHTLQIEQHSSNGCWLVCYVLFSSSLDSTHIWNA